MDPLCEPVPHSSTSHITGPVQLNMSYVAHSVRGFDN